MDKPITTKKRKGWRYSPLPRSAYPEPAQSSFLAPQEAWNLAWLSHPFDNPKAKAHASFTTAVRYTLLTKLSDGLIDMLGVEPTCNTIHSFFINTPPAEAVNRVVTFWHLKRLPLYELIGDVWIDRMNERLKLSRCSNPEDEVLALMFAQPGNFHDARSYLEKFSLRP